MGAFNALTLEEQRPLTTSLSHKHSKEEKCQIKLD
jgi:hypothetical protein